MSQPLFAVIAVFVFIFKVSSEEGQEEDFILESWFCLCQSESGLPMRSIFMCHVSMYLCLFNISMLLT